MILKNHNIHNINNLAPSNNITSMAIDIDEKRHSINEKDKLILKEMRKEAASNVVHQVTTDSLEKKQGEIIKSEEPKQKRKSIFMFHLFCQ